MTKKIRLMDETSETDKTASVGQDMVVKQLMKYLEAIDWKLWEMLKLMKAEQEEADEADSVDEDELPG